MQVAELSTKFNFIGDTKPLDKLNTGLMDAISSIGKTTIGMAGATVAFGALVKTILHSSDSLFNLSESIGVSSQSLQELGYVASVNGSSIDTMYSSMESLTRVIGDAAYKGSEDFSRLGISVRDSMGHVKNAETIFYEVRNALNAMNMSVQEKRGILSALGIDESLIQTMQLSSQELTNLRLEADKLGIISEKDGKRIVQFNDSVTKLTFGFSNLQQRLAMSFSPQLRDLADRFTDLLIHNKKAIDEGLYKFFTVIGEGFEAMSNFLTGIKDIAVGLLGVKGALMAAGTAVLYFNRAFLLSPVGILLAVVAAIDDISTGLKGGKSLVRDWVKSFADYDISSLVKTFEELQSGMNNYFSSLWKGIDETWVKITKFFSHIKNNVMELFGSVTDIFGVIGDTVSKFFNGETKVTIAEEIAKKDATKTILNTVETAKDTNGTVPKVMEPNLLRANDITRGVVSTSTIHNIQNSNANTNQVQNNNINVEIHTNDASTIPTDLKSELDSILVDANASFNRGV